MLPILQEIANAKIDVCHLDLIGDYGPAQNKESLQIGAHFTVGDFLKEDSYELVQDENLQRFKSNLYYEVWDLLASTTNYQELVDQTRKLLLENSAVQISGDKFSINNEQLKCPAEKHLKLLAHEGLYSSVKRVSADKATNFFNNRKLAHAQRLSNKIGEILIDQVQLFLRSTRYANIERSLLEKRPEKSKADRIANERSYLRLGKGPGELKDFQHNLLSFLRDKLKLIDPKTDQVSINQLFKSSEKNFQKINWIGSKQALAFFSFMLPRDSIEKQQWAKFTAENFLVQGRPIKNQNLLKISTDKKFAQFIQGAPSEKLSREAVDEFKRIQQFIEAEFVA